MKSAEFIHWIAAALAGLSLLALTACADSIEPPLTNPTAACAPYAKNPEALKVYALPSLAADDKAGRCNVTSMALAVHKLGEFRNIYGPETAEGAVAPSSVIDPVIDGLKRQASALCPRTQADCKPVFKILIFAHGGLVSHAGGVLGAESMAPGMLADGYAPVFLIWNSDFGTAYVDRLCCVRDGQEDSRYAAYFVPIRLGGDVAASGARAAENFGQQLIRFKESVVDRGPNQYFLQGDDLSKLCLTLQPGPCPDLASPKIIYPFPGLSPDAQDLNGLDQPVIEKSAGYVATLPLRVVATTVLPASGAEAWDNMVRRTRLALQEPESTSQNPNCAARTRESEANSSQRHGGADQKREFYRFHPMGEGAFATFFDRLECEIDANAFVDAQNRPVAVELYFYGHSMGALVGNELLVQHPNLPWRRIVYMAAATPVRDFRLMVAPMLDCDVRRWTQPCWPTPAPDPSAGVHFYSLMLHPLAESHDLEAHGAVPEGSLLEWIDEMFGGPKSVDDRMLGKWTNAEKMLTMFTPSERRRMTFRVFPAQERTAGGDPVEAKAFGAECTPGPADYPPPSVSTDRCHPIMHGEFAAYSFWRDDFLCGPDPCVEPEPPPRP